ncbi:replication initiator protein A [Priestia flexa]|uniref:replication initiator protein A n=1 Tax=Priestia flexa TaxID=86664 RepID=UPI002491B609|nr:replication initiator protein A [Priestia flexa]
MSKLKNDIPQGKKISGKQANTDRYIKLNEFLLFDPLYRDMTEKAKILYVFLRHKLPYFQQQTEAHESGLEETKSYRDDQGYIYCIADNTELEYILNCAESTLIRTKKTLTQYGLLIEEATKNGANRLYVLEPAALSERWTYIEEIKQLRANKKEKNKEKAVKYAKSSSKASNLQNESHGNLQNESHGNLQNESKNQSNVFKSNLNSKIKLNLSIYEDEINSSILPSLLKNSLIKKIDRLIHHNIQVLDIVKNYELHKQAVTEGQYISALDFALKLDKFSKSFIDVMSTNIKKQIEFEHNQQRPAATSKQKKRQEIVPEEIRKQIEADEQKEKEETAQYQQHTQQLTEDMILQEKVELLKDGFGKLTDAEIALALEKKFLTPEDLKRS